LGMKATRAQINELIRRIRAGEKPRPPGNHSEVVYEHPLLQCFGVRLTHKGQASWRYQRKVHGKNRKVTFGDVRLLDEKQALERARQLGAKLELEILDPQEAKARAREAAKVTFASVAEDFLKSRNIRPATLRHYVRHLRGNYFKSLHRQQFDGITGPQIASLLQEITRESGNEAALQAYKTLRAMFNWVIKYGDALHDCPNPMARVERPKENPGRERILSDAEIRTIWHTLATWDQDVHKGPSDLPIVIELLFLTACRAQEIGTLEWDEIKSDSIELPPRRTKNNRGHWLPITSGIRERLERVERRPGKKHVFGDNVQIGLDLNGKDESVDIRIAHAKRPPIKNWHLHDIRRTVRSKMSDMGIGADVAERIVNHVSFIDPMERIYDRSCYRSRIEDALTRWEQRLREIVGEPPARQAPERKGQARLIQAALQKSDSSMSIAELAEETGLPTKRVRVALTKMRRREEIARIERGRYQYLLPEKEPTL
jgi:integrase